MLEIYKDMRDGNMLENFVRNNFTNTQNCLQSDCIKKKSKIK